MTQGTIENKITESQKLTDEEIRRYKEAYEILSQYQNYLNSKDN